MEQQQADNKKTTVYLPRQLDQWIREQAKKNRRSYNSEIVWLLEQQQDAQQRREADATR